MSNMRYASLVGYERTVLEGLRSRVKKQVMATLFESSVPMTRRMIEVTARIRISSVTPAVLDLLNDGFIRIAYEGEDPHSGYVAEFLEPVYPQPVQRSFEGLFGSMGQTALTSGTVSAYHAV